MHSCLVEILKSGRPLSRLFAPLDFYDGSQYKAQKSAQRVEHGGAKRGAVPAPSARRADKVMQLSSMFKFNNPAANFLRRPG